MKKTLSLAAFGLLALAASPVFAAEYAVDADHSTVGFQIRHLLAKVNGGFKSFEGTFTFDEKQIDKAQVKFTVKTASINTNNDKRDDHLRSADFFDAATMPTMEFASKKVTSLGKKKFKIEGDFTLRGVTKPVTFNAEYMGTEKDPWGNQKAGFSATGKVNRKDFGMTFNKVLDSGSLMLGDEVAINLEIEALEKKVEQKK